MLIHELESNSANKTARRVGRGGKRGTTCGRGTKGQKSRSGRKLRPAVRDLILRIPKHRGFRNKRKSVPARTVSLVAIASAIRRQGGGGVEIDRSALAAYGLLPPNYRGPVKVIGNGHPPTGLKLKGLAVSQEVRRRITAAKGKVL
ncbi:MAG: uL15 family ribosomal protein [Candidatus Liptonbacteria bacterium]|nr:uL15 family ribosomal protein [Candidatus Liptonbacteria bacterium]